MAKKWSQLKLPVDEGMDDQIPPKGWRRRPAKVTEDHQTKADELLRRTDQKSED